MNLLITGGAGYIGSHTTLSFLDNNHTVTIIDNLETGNINLIPKKAKFVKGDISDTGLITKILNSEKFDAAIHLAASISVEESVKNPQKYFLNNTDKAKFFFDTCIKNKLTNFVFSSTAAVYGESNKIVSEEAQLNPINPYAESKIKTENYLKQLESKNLAKYICLRFFNVAGSDPNLRSGLVTKNATHLLKKVCEVVVGKRDFLTVYGKDYPTHDGTAVRDYVHVSDLADIHLLVTSFLLDKKKSMTFNCGYGKGLSVMEVINEINSIISKPIKIMIGKRRPGDCSFLVADNKKILKNIMWKPKFNNLKLILSSTLEWEKKLEKNK